jgi:Protein of unknown function (DUF1571)
MAVLLRLPICRALLVAFAVGAMAWPSWAEERAGGQLAHTNNDGRRTANFRPTPEGAPSAADHPLVGVIDYARREQAYLNATVQDFTCRLVKRERIDGILEEPQFIDMRVREEQREGGRVVQPLSIYLYFLGPASVARRKVLYVAGQNDGKMLVRNGGRHFDYVLAKVEPWGEAAQKESLVPITETGFNRALARMIDVLEKDMQIDPNGANTRVERVAGAKINDRPVHLIRIIHPKQQPGLEFHIANVFVDDELHVPVRVSYSGWSRLASQSPPLLAEYTYTDLKLNVGLVAGYFSPSMLRSNP